MALMAALEADLRALSAESRRRHPAVKDAAEHAIIKVSGIIYVTPSLCEYTLAFSVPPVIDPSMFV